MLILVLGLLPAGPKPGAPSPADSRTPDATAVPPTDWRQHDRRDQPADALPHVAPSRPEAIPPFDAPRVPDISGSAAPADNRMHSFRALRVTSVEPLSGALAQAQAMADRLAHARWPLSPDGTLTAEDADLPVLRTASVHKGTRLLHGEHTRTTDISSTTTWVDVRLHTQAGRTARLGMIRAATGITHAVIAYQEFGSTVTTPPWQAGG